MENTLNVMLKMRILPPYIGLHVCITVVTINSLIKVKHFSKNDGVIYFQFNIYT